LLSSDVRQLARRRPDADRHAEVVAELARIDLRAIAGDDSLILQVLEPLRHGWRGQANAAAEFSQRCPRIALQLLEQAQVRCVEEPPFGRTAIMLRSGVSI